jgi:WASH complex subunit strumpellin|eukprot:g6604.t1
MADEVSFVAPDNLCGQTLLRLVARGSSIMAELFRLSQNIPPAFQPTGGRSDEAERYAPVLFDFRYLKTQEIFERQVNKNVDLQIVDEELSETLEDILKRFYIFFESIHKYRCDLVKYIQDVKTGFYLQHSIDLVLLDKDGRQLLCEAVYLLGAILLLLDLRIPGPIREKIIVAYYRYQGESRMTNFEDVCRLCKATGFIPGGKVPSGYPEDYLARVDIDEDVVDMVIGRLQADDIYLQTRAFPSPRHRSVALATQSCMLYTILYFTPRTLHKDRHKMREIVDRAFNDNWIITTYMGVTIDLSIEWGRYKAAKEALGNTTETDNVENVQRRNAKDFIGVEAELDQFLMEGVLIETYVLDHINPLLNTLRKANVSLRWLLLHRRVDAPYTSVFRSDSKRKKWNDIIVSKGIPVEKIISILFKTAQLEFKLKSMLNVILDSKEQRWLAAREQVAARMDELAQYFTGGMALTRVEKDDNLQAWFTKLASDVRSLEFGQSQLAGNVAGRKIQNTISALEDVERFEEIDTSLQIKQFLFETRDLLTQMVRIVNVTPTVVQTLDTISDFSYAWELINAYVPQFHARVRRDPKAVILLRAVFLKLVSILDVPLTRIVESSSPDYESVADYYSGELVAFVRRVLDVIPRSIFQNLSDIISILTNRLQALPLKLETVRLKVASQLEQRYELSQRTHQISVFSEGVLAMEETKLGMIEVDSRQILDDGIRKELVRQISNVMHNGILALDVKGKKKNSSSHEVEAWLRRLKQSLEGFKSAVSYIQDYISMYGMKMWQEEFSRIINFNIEQECNRFLKKKVVPESSIFWKRAIPIPRLLSNDRVTVNFMGRLVRHLEILTEYKSTIYAMECSGWYDRRGNEVAGIKLFSLLNSSVGSQGLYGIDRLLSFQIVHKLKSYFKFVKEATANYVDALSDLRSKLKPQHTLPSQNLSVYQRGGVEKLSKLWPTMLNFVQSIGQAQLLRRSVANELQFSCQLDSNLLSQAIDNFNKGLMADLRQHYKNPDEKPAPSAENPVLFEFSKYLAASGKHDPLKTIFVTSEPMYSVPITLFLLSVYCVQNLVYDKNLVALIRRSESQKVRMDGAVIIVGILTILKQFHSEYIMDYIMYMGQFIRKLMHVSMSAAQSGKIVKPSAETKGAIVMLEHLVHFGGFSRSVLSGAIPPSVLDLLNL